MNHPNELVVPLPETHTSIVEYSHPSASSYRIIAQNITFLVQQALRVQEAEQAQQIELQERLSELTIPGT